MRWRDPKTELPDQDQIVWVLLAPHKPRGTLRESARSIRIVCGEANFYPQGVCVVESYDELGTGNEAWVLRFRRGNDCDPYRDQALAWMPVDEMLLPEEKK